MKCCNGSTLDHFTGSTVERTIYYVLYTELHCVILDKWGKISQIYFSSPYSCMRPTTRESKKPVIDTRNSLQKFVFSVRNSENSTGFSHNNFSFSHHLLPMSGFIVVCPEAGGLSSQCFRGVVVYSSNSEGFSVVRFYGVDHWLWSSWFGYEKRVNPFDSGSCWSEEKGSTQTWEVCRHNATLCWRAKSILLPSHARIVSFSTSEGKTPWEWLANFLPLRFSDK